MLSFGWTSNYFYDLMKEGQKKYKFDKNSFNNNLGKCEMPHCAEMDNNNPHRLIDHLQFHIFHLLQQNQQFFQSFAHCDFHLRWFTCPLVFGFWLLSHVIYLQAEKMVFCYQNCSDLMWEKIVLVIEKTLQFENFDITWTIHSNSERSEQFLVTECFFNFLEIFQISKNWTIIIQIGTNYWNLEICRKS